MQKKHLLALMGEALIDLLPPDEQDEALWCSDDALEHLVIPPESLSPICNNLVDLHLDGKEPCTITGPVISFVLRHFPSLEKMGKNMPVSLGIKILYYVYYKADPRRGKVSGTY